MSDFSPSIINQLKNELQNLSESMDIPYHHQKDAKWILDNVSLDNSGHRNLQKLIRIATIIANEELKGKQNDK